MAKAYVLTPWSGSGKLLDPFHPLLDDYYTVNYSDVTGQPNANIVPNPNLLVIQVTTDDETMAKIAADTRFKVIAADASMNDKIKNGVMLDLIAFLSAAGVSTSQTAALLTDDMTREAATDKLRSWLRDQPLGKVPAEEAKNVL